MELDEFPEPGVAFQNSWIKTGALAQRPFCKASNQTRTSPDRKTGGGSYQGLTVGGGLEKLSQGRNFFFLIPARTQLSAYVNHEFKIIPTPTQLSTYANHELKNWCYIVKVARR